VYQGHLAICSQPKFLQVTGATTNGDYYIHNGFSIRHSSLGMPTCFVKDSACKPNLCLLCTKPLALIYGVHNFFCSQCDSW